MAVVSGTHYDPSPPLVGADCKYQVQIDRNEHTYKCYTEQEYQTMIQQRAQAAEKSTQAMNQWLAHNWGWILLVFGVLVLGAIFKPIKFGDDSYDRFIP